MELKPQHARHLHSQLRNQRYMHNRFLKILQPQSSRNFKTLDSLRSSSNSLRPNKDFPFLQNYEKYAFSSPSARIKRLINVNRHPLFSLYYISTAKLLACQKHSKISLGHFSSFRPESKAPETEQHVGTISLQTTVSKDPKFTNVLNPWDYLWLLLLKNAFFDKRTLKTTKELSFEQVEQIIVILSNYSSKNYQRKLFLLKSPIESLETDPALPSENKTLPTQDNTSAYLFDFDTSNLFLESNIKHLIPIYNLWTAHSTFQTLQEISFIKYFEEFAATWNQEHHPPIKTVLQKLYLKGFHSFNAALCLNAIIFNTSGVLISREHRRKLYNRFFTAEPESKIPLSQTLLLSKYMFDQVSMSSPTATDPLQTFNSKYEDQLVPNDPFDLNQIKLNPLLKYLFGMDLNTFVVINSNLASLQSQSIQSLATTSISASFKHASQKNRNQRSFNRKRSQYDEIETIGNNRNRTSGNICGENSSVFGGLDIKEIKNRALVRALTLLRKTGDIEHAAEIYKNNQDDFNKNSKLMWYNNLVFFYAVNNDFVRVSTILGQMLNEKIHPDIVTWNSIAKGLFENGKPGQVLRLYTSLGEIRVDPYSFAKTTNNFGFLSDIEKWKSRSTYTPLDSLLSHFIRKLGHSITEKREVVVYSPSKASHSVIIGGLKKNRLYSYLSEYKRSLSADQANLYHEFCINLILLRNQTQKNSFVSNLVSQQNVLLETSQREMRLVFNNVIAGCAQKKNFKTAALVLTTFPQFINEFMIAPLLELLVFYCRSRYDRFINDSLFNLILRFLPQTVQSEIDESLIIEPISTSNLSTSIHFKFSDDATQPTFARIIYLALNSVDLKTRNNFNLLITKNNYVLSRLFFVVARCIDSQLFLEIATSLFAHMKNQSYAENHQAIVIKSGLINGLVQLISENDPELGFFVVFEICNSLKLVPEKYLKEHSAFFENLSDGNNKSKSKRLALLALKDTKLLDGINHATLRVLVTAALRQDNIELMNVIRHFFQFVLNIEHVDNL